MVSSRTSLKLQLQSSHFGSPVHSPQGNGLILRCTARIGNLYQENAEIELGVPQRDPVPARGKLSSFYVTGEINNIYSRCWCFYIALLALCITELNLIYLLCLLYLN